jgi:toxin HigB-1
MDLKASLTIDWSRDPAASGWRSRARLMAGELRSFQAQAERKLLMLDEAVVIGDLSSPPGNRLKPLDRDRKGQHSIRINEQWRICFRWTPQGPEDVEIVDYH